jgi:dipeptidyl aminopeptidase/acylaminoacyl peptidase
MATPTLVIHGAKDFRVPDCNGLAYYHTLKARGVDARLLWFPDENHWVLQPANSLLWYREFLAWVGRYTASTRSSVKPSRLGRSATTPGIGASPV